MHLVTEKIQFIHTFQEKKNLFTAPILSFRDLKFVIGNSPRICKDILSRGSYGLMVYCKLQCQNLTVYMYIH